jgi:hypothetical protein
MKKKSELEADLDPRGTRHTRPGSKAAESALANSRSAPTRKRPASAAGKKGGAATKRKR